MNKLLTIAIASLTFGATAANAVVTITVEAPGVEHSTQTLITPAMATFDALTPGVQSGITLSAAGTVATIDTVNVLSADRYGGAGGTGRYAAVLSGKTTTITFTGAPANYFGFYASAIDAGSTVTVFSGLTQVYTHALPLVPIATGHFGNPDAPFTGQNVFEGYAFFNVMSSSAITSVVFSQAPTGGNFEFDNLTIAAVPEPANWALMFAGFAMVGFSIRRRTAYASA